MVCLQNIPEGFVSTGLGFRHWRISDSGPGLQPQISEEPGPSPGQAVSILEALGPGMCMEANSTKSIVTFHPLALSFGLMCAPTHSLSLYLCLSPNYPYLMCTHHTHTHFFLNDLRVITQIVRLPRWCWGKETASQCRRCKRCGYDP